MAAEEVKFVFTMDDQFSDKAKQAEQKVGVLESKLNSVAGAVVGAFSVGAIVNFGKAVVDSFGKMEVFKTSLTTMLRGNANEAEALNNQLIQIAKTTPFELTEVQDATRQLIAFGSQAGDVGNELITLGNVASGVGAPIKDIAYLYGTVRTQGRAMTVDINQFANRGIPIWSELEKITGKTGIALRKFVEDGKVGFPQIQQVMANLTKEGGQFFGLMEAQSKTVAGQISNLGDSWEQLKVSIGESQSGIIKSTINFASQVIGSLAEIYSEENKLEKRLTQGGAKKFGFFEKKGYFGLTNGQEDYLANLNMSRGWDDAIARAAKEDKRTGNAENLNRLLGQTAQGISSLIDRRGTMESEDYTRVLAILKGVQDDIKGNIDLLKSAKENEIASPSKPSNEADKKQADKLKTPHYTQITINIDQMTGVETIELDKTESIGQNIGEQILKEMVKAVTDSQIVAGAVK